MFLSMLTLSGKYKCNERNGLYSLQRRHGLRHTTKPQKSKSRYYWETHWH